MRREKKQRKPDFTKIGVPGVCWSPAHPLRTWEECVGCAAAPKLNRHLHEAVHGAHGPAVAAPHDNSYNRHVAPCAHPTIAQTQTTISQPRESINRLPHDARKSSAELGCAALRLGVDLGFSMGSSPASAGGDTDCVSSNKARMPQAAHCSHHWNTKFAVLEFTTCEPKAKHRPPSRRQGAAKTENQNIVTITCNHGASN